VPALEAGNSEPAPAPSESFPDSNTLRCGTDGAALDFGGAGDQSQSGAALRLARHSKTDTFSGLLPSTARGD